MKTYGTRSVPTTMEERPVVGLWLRPASAIEVQARPVGGVRARTCLRSAAMVPEKTDMPWEAPALVIPAPRALFRAAGASAACRSAADIVAGVGRTTRRDRVGRDARRIPGAGVRMFEDARGAGRRRALV